MPLSINNPPFVNVDMSPVESPTASATRLAASQTHPASGGGVSRVPIRNDDARVPRSEVMLYPGAFAKLFDMLELFFKSIREMFSGGNIKLDALPDAEKSPAVRPDAGGLRPAVPVTPARVQPVQPRPVVNVTKDSNAQVNVEVTVNHCHYPDIRPEHGYGPRPRVAPDGRVTSLPQPKVVPEVGIKPSVPLQTDTMPKPGVTPQPMHRAIPAHDTKPKVSPSVPDLISPEPVDNRADRNGRDFIPRTWLRR